MRPDILQHNPDPTYLRELIAKIGFSQRAIARAMGVDETLFRKYITSPDNASYRECPYLVQFTLEQWAREEVRKSDYSIHANGPVA